VHITLIAEHEVGDFVNKAKSLTRLTKILNFVPLRTIFMVCTHKY